MIRDKNTDVEEEEEEEFIWNVNDITIKREKKVFTQHRWGVTEGRI